MVVYVDWFDGSYSLACSGVLAPILPYFYYILHHIVPFSSRVKNFILSYLYLKKLLLLLRPFKHQGSHTCFHQTDLSWSMMLFVILSGLFGRKKHKTH